jgi:hypothetical protein
MLRAAATTNARANTLSAPMRLATIPDDKIASSVPSGAATAMPVGTSVLPLAGTMMSTALARSEPASVLGEKNVVVGYSCFSSSSSSFSSFLPAPAASLPWAPSVSLSFSGYSSVCCLRVAEEGAVTRWRAKKGGTAVKCSSGVVPWRDCRAT